MALERDDTGLRGAIMAAAGMLGVPLELTDDDVWSVEGGAVRVGLGFVRRDGRRGVTVARTLLLLWESVREVRFAPLRRSRRLAAGRLRPELEPLLGALDRMLAAAELLAAFPAWRSELGQVFRDAQVGDPAELPRHLQWVALLLAYSGDAYAGELLLARLDGAVQEEWAGLARFGGARAHGLTPVEVLRIACAPDAGRSPLRRFERAYALVEPVYVRLRERDLADRGLGLGGGARGGGDEAQPDSGADAAGTRGAEGDAEARPGGGAEDAVSGGERPDSGLHEPGEPGADDDLFAAARDEFVGTVLATPLPATGDWPAGLEVPDDVAARGNGDPGQRAAAGAARQDRPVGETSMAQYRERSRDLASDIDELRGVWRRVVSDRLGVRARVSRRPTPDGDMLDRDSLVRIVTEVVAGVERPNAYVSRERAVKRTRREGSTDYVLLIDRSASMQGAAAEAAADAALIMLESLAAVTRDIAAEERALRIDLELSIRTALIVFDSGPTVVKPLSAALSDEVRRRMHAEIRAPRGSTNDAEALDAAIREFGIDGASPRAGGGFDRHRVLIVVSDGGTDDGGAAADRLQTLRAAGVSTFGIGIRTDDLVTRFAPGGVRINDPSHLPRALARLVAAAGLDTEPSKQYAGR